MSNSELFLSSVILKNIPSYSTKVVVGNESLILNFNWNQRLGTRTLQISNLAGTCYLPTTLLRPSEPIKLYSNAFENGFSYEVILVGLSDRNLDLYNWKDNYVLSFYQYIPIVE